MAAAQAKRGKDPDPRVVFLRNFFKRPKEVGSVIPSSRFLERRIVRCADLADARMVVELGPGTGGTTRALLHAMRPDAKLLAIEINPQLVRLIRSSIRDPRLVVQAGDAGDLARILAVHGLPAPDVVLSGIPFSTMPVDVGRRILEAVNAALAPGGRFVAYQLRDRVEILGKRVFGTARKQMELRNLPPMRVYRFEKTPAPLAP